MTIPIPFDVPPSQRMEAYLKANGYILVVPCTARYFGPDECRFNQWFPTRVFKAQ